MNRNDIYNIVFDKTKGKCHLCGRPLSFYFFDVDHNIPKSLGGSDELYNLYPACVYCNRSKGNQSSVSIRSMNGITLNDVYGDNDNNGIWVCLGMGLFFYLIYKDNQRVQQKWENYYKEQEIYNHLININNSFQLQIAEISNKLSNISKSIEKLTTKVRLFKKGKLKRNITHPLKLKMRAHTINPYTCLKITQ